jgi:hypothetical protein
VGVALISRILREGLENKGLDHSEQAKHDREALILEGGKYPTHAERDGVLVMRCESSLEFRKEWHEI